MKKNLLACLALLFLFSCTTTEIPGIDPVIDPNTEQEEENPDRPVQIGKQLPNPYAVSTMKQAFRNLRPATRALADENALSLRISTSSLCQAMMQN